MAHEIASPVICRLCGKTFTKPAGQVIINPQGGSKTNRLAQFLLNLSEHIAKDHPRVDQGLQVQAVQFLGLIRMMVFDVKDLELFEQRDLLRWQVHQATLAGRLTDDALEARSKELAAEFQDIASPDRDPEAVDKIQARLIEVFKGYRQIVEEPGRYPSTIQPAAGPRAV